MGKVSKAKSDKEEIFRTPPGKSISAEREFYESPRIIFVPLTPEERLMACGKDDFSCGANQKLS